MFLEEGHTEVSWVAVSLSSEKKALNLALNKVTCDMEFEALADLIVKFNLEEAEKPLWLHKEVVGWKDCHRWFVYNHKEWELFKDKVKRKVEEMKLKLDEAWQWNMLYESVKKLEDKKVLTSSKWKEKIEKKNISVHELVWLNTILMDRLYGRNKDE